MKAHRRAHVGEISSSWMLGWVLAHTKYVARSFDGNTAIASTLPLKLKICALAGFLILIEISGLRQKMYATERVPCCNQAGSF
jgi:hypothetical protein